MTRTALLLSTAIGLTFAASGPVAAYKRVAPDGAFAKKRHNFQTAPGAPARPARPGQAPTPAGLKETFVVNRWSDDAFALLAGFTLVDNVTLRCGRKPCTIITDTVANFASYYSYNIVSLCPAIDGYFTNMSCIGTRVPDHDTVPIPQLTNIALGAGTHLAEFYIYTLTPAYLAGYQIDYHVYK